MPKCDSCGSMFKAEKKYDTFYNAGEVGFCSPDCFKNYIESKQKFPFERDVEDRIRELLPGEMGGEPTSYSPRLRTSFRSGFEAVAAETFILNWGWKVYYEPMMIKINEHKTYIPDFYLPDKNCFLEVKGCWLGGSKKKFLQAQELLGPDRLILVHAGYRHWFKSDHADIGEMLCG